MKKNITVFLIMMFIFSFHSSSQLKEKDNLLGGSIGFWAKGEVPMFGVNFESQLTQAGIGTISLGGLFRYYSYTNNYNNGDSRKYTFTSFGAQSNYNFNQIGDGKFVPFVGLVLGYNSVNNTYTDFTKHGVYITDVTYKSGAWLWGQLGMRYFFSPNVAGSVRLGLGNNDFNTLELGVDFKL
ncbi:MAG: hypothetical protein ABI543_08865 [Ignavibacteria bacterium]